MQGSRSKNVNSQFKVTEARIWAHNFKVPEARMLTHNFKVLEARMLAHNSRFEQQGCGPIIQGSRSMDVESWTHNFKDVL
jgi:hypothetical protein